MLRRPSSPAGPSTAACRVFAVACAAAVILDTYSYRPGLSTTARWRREPGPLSFAVLAPLAERACLEACRRGALLAHGVAVRVLPVWRRVVELVAPLGNPGAGSTLLLTLQAAGLGYAVERVGSDALEHVMGGCRAVVESEGVEGAEALYRALLAVAPSYLARIGYSGLPDASTSLAPSLVREAGVTLNLVAREASLYDTVMLDVATCFTVSLGYAYPLVCSSDLLDAIARATHLVAGVYGDMLVRRKLGREPRGLWLEAARGSRRALEELSKLLDGAGVGPGSAADVVVNAAARCVYDRLRRLWRLST